MQVLVTGGAGFLGSHMVDYILLQHKDSKVTVVDNLQTGSLENLKHLQGNDRVKFICFDVIEMNELYLGKYSSDSAKQTNLKTILETKWDQIYHMACAASPPHYQKDPVHTLLTCIQGTNNILQIAKKHNSRVLFTGTSEVYGDPEITPQTEEYWGHVNCAGIRSCYDEGKRAAETLLFDYNRQFNTQVRVARIFNTYGPRMNLTDGRIISNFVYQALNNEPLTVYGSGNQTRSFCYCSDQIRGLWLLMNQDKTVGPVNIGNPDEHTVLEMAQIIRKEIGETKENEIVFKELPSDDPKQRRPETTKAKTILGWEPKVSLMEGLKLTIEDFKNRMK